MDFETIVRQAFRTLALSKSAKKRDELLALLPELLAYIELLRRETQQLIEYGALD